MYIMFQFFLTWIIETSRMFVPDYFSIKLKSNNQAQTGVLNLGLHKCFIFKMFEFGSGIKGSKELIYTQLD